MDRRTTRWTVNAVFRDLALLIGELAMTHQMGDTVAWRLARGLDRLRRKHLELAAPTSASTNDSESLFPRLLPHPAIEAFLRTIRDDEERASTWGQRERDRLGPERTGKRR